MVYREIKQAVIDIETMFAILGREPEIKDKPGAVALHVQSGAIRSRRAFRLRAGAPDPEGTELESRPAARSRSWPFGSR